MIKGGSCVVFMSFLLKAGVVATNDIKQKIVRYYNKHHLIHHLIHYTGSTISEKRNLINLVFANLTLKPEKLDFKLRSPFDTFVQIAKTEEWRALKDSNL